MYKGQTRFQCLDLLREIARPRIQRDLKKIMRGYVDAPGSESSWWAISAAEEASNSTTGRYSNWSKETGNFMTN
jgi:hypothetical protein